MSSDPRPGGPESFDRAVAGAHADYRRELQQHTVPDERVDDVVTYRMLAPHLMRTLLFLVAPTVLGIVKLLVDYLASVSSPDEFTDLLSALLGVVVVVLYLAGIAAFFAPAKEPIAEYSQLLEDRAPAAASAYDRVRHAAAARQSPADVRPATVGGVPVLVFRQHSERAMLLVQPYGRDLYVGWTMWRSRSSATLLVHFLRDTFGRFAATPRFTSELRAASTRALRESVHSLSREGVTAAVHATETGPPPGAWSAPPESDARQAPHIPHAPHDEPAVHAEPDARAPGALPGAATGPDPSAGWRDAERAEPVRARREQEGWGPPPRDRW